MLPLSEPLLREIQREWPGPDGSTKVTGVFEFMTPAVESWVRERSRGTAIAYIETEYFGGEGFERSAVFRDANVILGPLDGAGPGKVRRRRARPPPEPRGVVVRGVV